MGMALESYTNCTSPLRKYVDFLVHQQIKALLHTGKITPLEPQVLTDLSLRIATCRAATLEAERWLAGNYLTRLATEEGMVFKARVTHVSSGGFNAVMDDNGLQGSIDLRKDPEKFSYDKWTASLTSSTRRFELGQAVELTFVGMDRENQYTACFALLTGCGAKLKKSGT
jgi:ribonuclease R